MSRVRRCVERGCPNPPGGRWSPYWCPTHDRERVERISRRFEELARPHTDTGGEEMNGPYSRNETTESGLDRAYLSGGKRTNIAPSDWLDDWWVGYGKDESCQFEGPWEHMAELAARILAHPNTKKVRPDLYTGSDTDTGGEPPPSKPCGCDSIPHDVREHRDTDTGGTGR